MNKPFQPRNKQAMSTEEFFRQLFAGSEPPVPSASRVQGPPFNPDNPEELSTEEFFRQLFARDQDEAPQRPPAPAGRRSAFVARGSGAEDGRPNPLSPTYAPGQDGKDGARPGNAMNADSRTPPPAEPTLDKMERQGRGLPAPKMDDGEPLTEAEKKYLQPFYPDTNLDTIRIRRRVPGMLGGASGATTGNIIYMDPSYYPPDPTNDEHLRTLAEELAHSGQQKNNPGFYFRYGGEYAWDRLTGKSHDQAYNNISYEKEAKAKAKQVLDQMRRDRDAGRLPWPSAPSK